MLTEGALLYPNKPQVCVFNKREIAPVFLDEYCVLDAKNYFRKNYYTSFGNEVFSNTPSVTGQYIVRIDTQIEFVYSKELIESLHQIAFPAIHPNSSYAYYTDDVSGFITMLRVYKLDGYIDDQLIARGRQGSAVIIKLYSGNEETSVPSTLGNPVISDGRFEHIRDEIIHVIKSKGALIGVYNNDVRGRQLLQNVGDTRRSIHQRREYDITSDDDRAKYDYTKLYKEILLIKPNMAAIVDYISAIRPAQFGEIPILIAACNKGDQSAYMRLVDVHLRSILRLSCMYNKLYGTDIEDLFQDGVLGLFSGISHYDNKQGNASLSAYAGFWVKQSMQRLSIMKHNAVYVPVHIMEKAIRAKEMIANHRCEHCIKDTCAQLTEEIQHEYNVSYKLAASIIELYMPPVSLSAVVESEDSRTPVYQYILDANQIDVTPDISDMGNMIDVMDDRIDAAALGCIVQEAMRSLKPKEVEVLRRRFGFDSLPETLEEIGIDFKVTRERIRQIETKALSQIKHILTHNIKYKTYIQQNYNTKAPKKLGKMKH